MLSCLEAFQEAGRDITNQIFWNSSMGISHFMLPLDREFPRKRILPLDAGMGTLEALPWFGIISHESKRKAPKEGRMWSLELALRFKSWLHLPQHCRGAGYPSITTHSPCFLTGKMMAGMCLLLRTKQGGCVLYHANFNYSYKFIIRKW